MNAGWSVLLAEAVAARGRAPFPIPAYSEFMPAPYLGVKPYGEPDPFTRTEGDDAGWNVPEHEELLELRPGLEKIAAHLVAELERLARGETCQFTHTLLAGNPAWPAALAAGGATAAVERAFTLALSLALSKTQDDKGRVRWTLFGSSHEGPARAFWRSLAAPAGPGAEERFRRWIAWATDAPESALADLRAAGVRVLPAEPDPLFAPDEGLPDFARALRLRADEAVEKVRTLVTFAPFDRLAPAVQRAYLTGTLRLLPCPGSLVFWWHRGYRTLADKLEHALQIPLLHLFPRSEAGYGIRIPQSGWLDEVPDVPAAGARAGAGHKVVKGFKRSHRWQKTDRDHDPAAEAHRDDPVEEVLFSAEPDQIGLYGKPMARNGQVWHDDYERVVLDGPKADPAQLRAAAAAMHTARRFGYRFYCPPLRVGERSVFWHRPLCARRAADGTVRIFDGGLDGHLTAERPGAAPIELWPRILTRAPERAAAELFDDEKSDQGRRRLTTAGNVRKLLEWAELLGGPLAPSFARRLLTAGRETALAAWLAGLPGRARDPVRGARLADHLRARLGPEDPVTPATALTFHRTATREFEERYWRAIVALCEGDLREKNNADAILANEGRTGGARAAEIGRTVARERQLDGVADGLHRYYAEVIAAHGMTGRAFSADHRFRWETEFEYPWMDGWGKNQRRKDTAHERNLVVVIPGRDRGEAVVMADHYDTAYMEDLYEPGRGGDRLRAAAAGADDNHSATAALQLAADVLLPLARAGALARDVWLVHLTGEEFPADCLGARALARDLIEGKLTLTRPDGGKAERAAARVRGALVLDMVAHNHDHDRDVFQIAPGEGRGSARLAWRTHLANERWNRAVPAWNAAPGRHGRGRAHRIEGGAVPPPVAEHLALAGEVRPEWHPRSALYNTDGQIFSDVGIPVVLLMENYDISRTGYHDTHDTMKNIDLDYGAALVAIAIEAVADVATAEVI